MKLKVVLASAGITLAAAVSAHAAGCSSYGEKQAMTCGEGSVYDSQTNSCVPATS